jgi:hypothetical protein
LAAGEPFLDLAGCRYTDALGGALAYHQACYTQAFSQAPKL